MRSPELRAVLKKSIGTERIHEEVKDRIKYAGETNDPKDPFPMPTKSAIRERYKQAEKIITEIERILATLAAECDSVSDDEFDERLERIETIIDSTIKDVVGYSRRPYWLPPTPERITEDTCYPSYPPINLFNLADENSTFTYEEQSRYDSFKPTESGLHWKPCKEDIGRILSVAISTHETRISRGEISADTPISIVDVGGANASLAQMLVTMGRDNGITIDYRIVDPDKDIITMARKMFPQLFTYSTETAREFAINSISDRQIVEILFEREAQAQVWKNRYYDLHRIIDHIRNTLKTNKEVEEQFRNQFLDSLKNDFAINIPDSARADSASFIDFFERFVEDSDENEYTDLPTRWKNQKRSELANFTDRVEDALISKPVTCDLVINSWMPKNLDFTPDIRAINGAAIVYALARDRSTGINDVVPSTLQALDQDTSYSEGRNYSNQYGWVGRASDRAEQSLIPYCNCILIQTRHDFREPLRAHGVGTEKINIDGEYRWVRRPDDAKVSPVAELTDKTDIMTFFFKQATAKSK